MVKNGIFVSDARASSKTGRDEITLSNSKGQGWASYRVELKKPIDLRGMELSYSARGDSGGE
jgi:hypothetical protein